MNYYMNIEAATNGQLKDASKLALTVVCTFTTEGNPQPCGKIGFIPFVPPANARWKRPTDWLQVVFPALSQAGWAPSVSSASDGTWITCMICPECVTKMKGED